MISPARLARISVTLGLLACAPDAQAQGERQGQTARPCAARTAVIERLETRYGETRQSMGLNRANGVMEFFASEETGTWTILVTMPNGLACLIASGELWEPDLVPVRRSGKDA